MAALGVSVFARYNALHTARHGSLGGTPLPVAAKPASPPAPPPVAASAPVASDTALPVAAPSADGHRVPSVPSPTDSHASKPRTPAAVVKPAVAAPHAHPTAKPGAVRDTADAYGI